MDGAEVAEVALACPKEGGRKMKEEGNYCASLSIESSLNLRHSSQIGGSKPLERCCSPSWAKSQNPHQKACWPLDVGCWPAVSLSKIVCSTVNTLPLRVVPRLSLELPYLPSHASTPLELLILKTRCLEASSRSSKIHLPSVPTQHG